VDDPGVLVGDPFRVTNDEGADPLGDGPGDEGPGGFMVGLADAALVGRLGSPLGGAQLTPTPRTPLAPRRLLAGHVALAGFGVG